MNHAKAHLFLKYNSRSCACLSLAMVLSGCGDKKEDTNALYQKACQCIQVADEAVNRQSQDLTDSAVTGKDHECAFSNYEEAHQIAFAHYLDSNADHNFQELDKRIYEKEKHMDDAWLARQNAAFVRDQAAAASIARQKEAQEEQNQKMAQMLEHAAAVKKMDIFQASYAGETDRVAELLTQEPERAKLKGSGIELGLGGDEVAAIQVAANAQIVRLLVRAGADVNTTTTDSNESALDIAVSRNHADVVKELIVDGAHVDRNRIIGESPLLRSCGLDDDDIMVALLDAGADPNAKSGIYDYNALAQVVSRDQNCSVKTRRRIKLLLAHNVDKDALVDSGITPLDIAIKRQNVELITFLRNLGFHAKRYQ